MAEHRITVTLVRTNPDTVSADPNPAPRNTQPPLQPGDTVRWTFTGGLETRYLQVGFEQVRDLPSGNREPCNPLGPFSSLSLDLQTRQIVGTVRSDIPSTATPSARYFYKIVERGVALAWDPPVLGAPNPLNGGGLDTSGRPPGGG
jgi:hypothetical protein